MVSSPQLQSRSQLMKPRDDAAAYWPNKGISGKELHTIYRKIAALDKKLAYRTSSEATKKSEDEIIEEFFTNLTLAGDDEDQGIGRNDQE